MQSLFDPKTYANLVDRFNALDPQLKPHWGVMSPSQMMAHCSAAFDNALTKEKPKRMFIGFLFGKMAQKMITSPKPFKKNITTAPNFKITDQRNFDQEKTKLLNYLEKFHRGGPDVVTKHAHTFFGKMSAQQWDQLMTKHLDHHLTQFGV